ncbi:hypothetical protein REPUB_Repub13aG0238800 [Reevesia pubescens]
MSLKCAVQLGIPDIVHNHGEPITISELVSALNIDPTKSSCIYRLMRMLVHSGFFAKTKVDKDQEKEAYVLTPFSQILLKDKMSCSSPIVVAMLRPVLMTSWQFFGDSLQGTKERPFEIANGKPIWDYMNQDPEFKNHFHATMECDSQMMNLVIKDLFDFPHVVANLSASGNLNFVGGDLFQHIPSADAILMKLVLHGFEDEDCIKILKRCREAIPTQGAKGKVIIIDIVINEEKDEHELTEAKLYFDMMMMVAVSGREKSEQDWEKLFLAAGFSDYKITPMFGLRSLIEVYP